MTQPVLRTIPIEEYYYVETLVHSDIRHEFVDGVMVAMTGGSPLHAELAGRVHTIFAVATARRLCKVYPADLRVRSPAYSRVFYPDVTVVCEKAVFDYVDRFGDTLVNPLVIIEVLSKTTSDYDFETKLPAYQAIKSLRTILYVHQDHHFVEVWTRLPSSHWEHNSFVSGSFEVIGLTGVVFDVDALYQGTDTP